MITLGPQGEPILELRDVAVDGPGFGPTKVPTSAVANGTDREQAITKFATNFIGPQGEIIRPVCEEGICPLCQQSWPETASQPGEDLDPRAPVEEPDADESLEDPNVEPVDDRENMFELLRKRK